MPAIGGTGTGRDFDVVGVGNAIVDILAHATDDVLVGNDLVKGSMMLIDSDRADFLYGVMGPALEASGGSAANTIAGVASFGGAAAFVGKIRDDQFGQVFGHDIRALGIHFDGRPAASGPPTGRSFIFVTPDGERTMNTCLGIAAELEPADVDTSLMGRAAITYCEGYLWDVDSAKQAITVAMDAARAARSTVAFTLSDTFCVERHRDAFTELLENRIDILFANEAEICALYQVDALATAIDRLRSWSGLAFVTTGADGSIVVQDGDASPVAAEPVARIVDTTGAGDQYAAGVLYGLNHHKSPADAATLGSRAASECLSHIGPRPEVALSSLL